ncbi:hypothetical protein CF319_g6141 [Tilletia indica]|nr:hypothetical protein CF319_g6141 [Tilletia indica]
MLFSNEYEKAALEDLIKIGNEAVQMWPSYAGTLNNIVCCLLQGATYQRQQATLSTTFLTPPVHPSISPGSQPTSSSWGPIYTSSSYPTETIGSSIVASSMSSTHSSESSGLSIWDAMYGSTAPSEMPNSAIDRVDIKENAPDDGNHALQTFESMGAAAAVGAQQGEGTIDIEQTAPSNEEEIVLDAEIAEQEPEDNDELEDSLPPARLVRTPRSHMPRTNKPASNVSVPQLRFVAILQKRRGEPVLATRVCRLLRNMCRGGKDPELEEHLEPFTYESNTGPRFHRATSYDLLSDVSTHVYLGYIPGPIVDGKYLGPDVFLPDVNNTFFRDRQDPIPRRLLAEPLPEEP